MRRRAALVTLLAALAVTAPAGASTTQESTFQDDNLLVYDEPDRVARTLDTLRALGVDRIRVSVFWRIVAPGPDDPQRPQFDAADPAAYPPGAWNRYDTLLRLALARGIKVNFNLTGPAPNWSTGTPERRDIDQTFDPDGREFNLFTRAVGTRYSGTYRPAPDQPALPRVDYWTLWNEPNHAGWLTPQWVGDSREPGGMIDAAPRIYRELVDGAFEGLVATGHENDTILIGETAPKGLDRKGTTRSMKPGLFIRRLFCLDDHLQFLTGAAAEARGCPAQDQARRFAAEHPGLFRATGYAHHPYELTFSPFDRPKDQDTFTIANLNGLSNLLRRVYDRYGQPRRGGPPLYLTEFGYQTDPPDPLGVSLRQQSAYLNQSEYIAWRNRKVRTLAQFLLVDDKPLAGHSRKSVGAWGSTFQSGLLHLDARRKPAFESYQLPIHLPRSRVRRGSRLHVWGLVRVAPDGPAQQVQVLLRPRGAKRFRRISTTRTNRKGYVSTRVRVRRAGHVRLAWRAPGGRMVNSRSVAFRLRRR